jgi:hypothetical protein
VASLFRREHADRVPAAPDAVSVLGGLREAVRGGAAYGKRRAVPAGRAERLGLAELAPGAGTALRLPFEFLQLGDHRAAEPELAGVAGGLGVRVFEFDADEFAPGRGESAGSWSAFPYHAAAIELGYQLPWLAVSLRKLHAPSQPLYPGRRGKPLGLPDRRLDRDYVLHSDADGQARQIFGPSMLAWLAESLAVRIQVRPIVTLEVSSGWALAAVQARGLARPENVELQLQGRAGHPGPWPDVLLRLLRGFRDRVPPACKR